MGKIEEKKYYTYAEDVISGKITACKWIRLAAERFLNDLKRDDLVFDSDVVDRYLKFCSTLHHFKGKSAGQPFSLEPWQQFIVANLLGLKHKDTGYRKYTSALLCVARKAGKAHSVDTEILTTAGWTTFGRLRPGDYVYGDDGLPTKVLYVTPDQYVDTYKVTFDDHETAVVTGEHNWHVKTSGGFMTVTTRDMYSNYVYTKTDGTHRYRYHIPLCKPIEFPEKNLPIDPYTLGLWLGDGNTADGRFTASREKLECYEYVRKVYGDYVVYPDPREDKNCYTVSFSQDRRKSIIRGLLEDNDLIGNKHIPEDYLYASVEQRLALLQGLMDTDGSCSKAGQCEFSQKNPRIADGFCWLLDSLGIKYTRRIKVPTIDGVPKDPVTRVFFYMDRQMPCFRLSYKYERLSAERNHKSMYKAVTRIEKVDTVPCRCITVDNDSHLYCFGRRMTVSHNSAFAATLALWFLLFDGEGSPEIDFSANSREQASLCYEYCEQFSRQLDPSGKTLHILRNGITCKYNIGKVNVFAADASRLDGYNAHFFINDEAAAAKTSEIYDVLRSSQGARQQPLGLVISSAGFNLDAPFYSWVKTGQEILSGVKQDDSYFYGIYMLDEDDDWENEDVWIKANPNLDVTISRKYLQDQVVYAKNTPGALVGVLTKNFNKFTNVSTVWIPDDYILPVMQPVDLDYFDGNDTCILSFDLATTGDLCVVTGLFQKEIEHPDRKLYYKNFYYLCEAALRDSANRDIYRYWASKGYIKITSGNVVDYDYIYNDIMRLRDRYVIKDIGIDVWQSSMLVVKLTEAGFNINPVSQSIGGMSAPSKQFERFVRNNEIVIDNNPVTLWCFRNCTPKYDWNENLKITKDNYENKIDGVISMIIATARYMSYHNFGVAISTI